MRASNLVLFSGADAAHLLLLERCFFFTAGRVKRNKRMTRAITILQL